MYRSVFSSLSESEGVLSFISGQADDESVEPQQHPEVTILAEPGAFQHKLLFGLQEAVIVLGPCNQIS